MTTPQSTDVSTLTVPTDIAVLGAGRVGSTLAAKLASRGHRVSVGVRDPQAAQAKWTGPAVTFTDAAEAARNSQIIINATPGQTSLETLSALKAELDGKILIDVANATRRSEGNPLGELLYPGGSLAEELQTALPGTHVVKTLNTMMFMVMTAPHSLGSAPTAFLSGNDGEAKTTVRALLGGLGWTPEQIMDLGDVTTARGPEALFMFVPYIAGSLGFVPFAIGVAH